MQFKPLKKLISAILILLPFIASASSTVESFSAYYIQKEQFELIRGKVFAKGNKYRMDMEEEDEEISIIVDRETERTKILIHSQKAFQEILNESLKSLSNNPFEAARYSLEKYKSKEKGSETLEGYECQKTEIYGEENGEEKKLMTVWSSEKLILPVKIIQHLDSYREVKLKNIKEESLDESLFKPPEEYECLSSPETKKEKAAPEKKEIEESSSDIKLAKNIEESILMKLEERGIKRVTDDGTIKIRETRAPVLDEYFPNWKFFRITREKKIQGGTSFAYIQADKASASKDGEKVLLLSSPATDMPLENGLKMAQEENIRLTEREEIEEFADALDAIYFKDPKVKEIESLEQGKWAIYTGTFMSYKKGFLITIDEEGKITELDYSLKIKKK